MLVNYGERKGYAPGGEDLEKLCESKGEEGREEREVVWEQREEGGGAAVGACCYISHCDHFFHVKW